MPLEDTNDDRMFCSIALEAARLSKSEEGRPRPRVGAVLTSGGVVLGQAYRGELQAGEHAEYTLMQRKHPAANIRGATLYTTLEPCTTRDDPKRPCSDWIIDRGIGRVVIGMLDPNPRVYERGVARLREAGITIDFFPSEIRELVMEDNKSFIEQFRASPALEGTVSFNFTQNNGLYSFGNNELTFLSRWTNASSSSIHVYTDGTGLLGLGLAISARSFGDIRDASVYDTSSRVKTPNEGEFVVLRNAQSHYAALRIDDVKARSHSDPYDEVTISYRINPDGSSGFVE